MIWAVPCTSSHLVPFIVIVQCLALLQLSKWAPSFPRLSHCLEHASHLIGELFVLFLLNSRHLIVSRFLGEAFSDSTEEVSFSALHSCSMPYFLHYIFTPLLQTFQALALQKIIKF